MENKTENKREMTTIALEKYVVAEITGNRTQFIKEAIALKLKHDKHDYQLLLKAQIKSLKKELKNVQEV